VIPTPRDIQTTGPKDSSRSQQTNPKFRGVKTFGISPRSFSAPSLSVREGKNGACEGGRSSKVVACLVLPRCQSRPRGCLSLVVVARKTAAAAAAAAQPAVHDDDEPQKGKKTRRVQKDERRTGNRARRGGGRGIKTKRATGEKVVVHGRGGGGGGLAGWLAGLGWLTRRPKRGGERPARSASAVDVGFRLFMCSLTPARRHHHHPSAELGPLHPVRQSFNAEEGTSVGASPVTATRQRTGPDPLTHSLRAVLHHPCCVSPP